MSNFNNQELIRKNKRRGVKKGTKIKTVSLCNINVKPYEASWAGLARTSTKVKQKRYNVYSKT